MRIVGADPLARAPPRLAASIRPVATLPNLPADLHFLSLLSVPGRTAHLAKLIVANHFFANFTPTRHLTREPFKLHVGSEARHSQRPDPQIPAKTPLQACRVLQSDGGEYGRGWTNPYCLRSALVVRTPSFAVAGARSPATPSFPWLGRFVDAPPRRRLAWTWILGARA